MINTVRCYNGQSDVLPATIYFGTVMPYILMKSYLVSLLLTYLCLAVQQQRYTQVATITNPYGVQRIAFSEDSSMLFVYTEKSWYVNMYAGYNYASLGTDNLTPNLTVVTFFKDEYGRNNIVYGGISGSLYRKLYVDGTTFVFPLQNVGRYLKDVIVSNDGQYYAAFCEGRQTVYIGRTTTEEQPKDIRFEEDIVTISCISWRPKSHQLLISKRNATDASFFELYDINQKTSRDLSAYSDQTVVSSAWNQQGDKIYFIEDNSGPTIKILNLLTQSLTFLTVTDADQLKRVEIRGNFLSAYDDSFVFVFNILNGEVGYGSYPSNIISGGLSPDGSVLLTFSQMENADIAVYKLCSGHSCYVLDQDSCQQCSNDCAQCFLEVNHCSTCSDGAYLSNFKCLQCSDAIKYCVSCQNNRSCTQCNSSLNRVPNNYNTSCICDDGKGWTPFGQDCVCDAYRGFIASGSSCVCDAANGWIAWKSSFTGCECDRANHWIQKGKLCVCDAANGWARLGSGCVCDAARGMAPSEEGCACDTANHWIPSNQGCSCDILNGWVASDSGCVSSSSNSLVILLTTVGGVLVLSGGLALFLKIRKGKKKDTLLDSDTIEYQGVDS